MSRHPSPRDSGEALTEARNFNEDLAVERSPRKPPGCRRSLFPRWYLLLPCLVLGYLGALYHLSKAPKQYTATATLQIKPKTARDFRSGESELRDLKTMGERIKRPDLMERVASRQDVRDLPGLMPTVIHWQPEWLRRKPGSAQDHASPLPPPPGILGDMVSRWTKVSIRPGTWLIDVSVTHPVPDVSPSLADALIREYLAEIHGSLSRERAQARATALHLYARAL